MFLAQIVALEIGQAGRVDAGNESVEEPPLSKNFLPRSKGGRHIEVDDNFRISEGNRRGKSRTGPPALYHFTGPAGRAASSR